MVKAVTYILENDATVQSLVGNRSGGDTLNHKVFPVASPQSEKEPYIVVTQIGRIQSGKSCDYTYTIQMASFASSYDDVTELSEAAITAVTAIKNQTVNGISYGFNNLTNESDDFDKDRNLYAKIVTFEGSGSPV